MYCMYLDCEMNQNGACTDLYASRIIARSLGAVTSCLSYNPIYPEEDTDE